MRDEANYPMRTGDVGLPYRKRDRNLRLEMEGSQLCHTVRPRGKMRPRGIMRPRGRMRPRACKGKRNCNIRRVWTRRIRDDDT